METNGQFKWLSTTWSRLKIDQVEAVVGCARTSVSMVNNEFWIAALQREPMPFRYHRPHVQHQFCLPCGLPSTGTRWALLPRSPRSVTAFSAFLQREGEYSARSLCKQRKSEEQLALAELKAAHDRELSEQSGASSHSRDSSVSSTRSSPKSVKVPWREPQPFEVRTSLSCSN